MSLLKYFKRAEKGETNGLPDPQGPLMDEIPDELVINWDQTGIHYVPVSSWTMEKEESKRVEIAGIDDKCQITAVFACSITGDFLPIQLIYKVRQRNAFPRTPFPSDWHIIQPLSLV